MVDNEPEEDPKEDGQGEEDPDKSGGTDDIAELTKKITSMEKLIEKQQEVIKKFEGLGKESPPAKTDAERILELETTLELFKKKMETEQQAKEQAERQKREAAVNALIKEMPDFKDKRDTLMKVDQSVLELFTKQKTGTTPNPIGRIGNPTGNIDWNKKIAAATERKKQRNEALQAIKY